MGISKTNLFSTEQNELANIAKVLAHPARIAIIEHLIKANACINGDLVQELGLAQATISQHLRELKEIGIIRGSIEGSSMSYCINTSKWNEIRNQIDLWFSKYDSESAKTCC